LLLVFVVGFRSNAERFVSVVPRLRFHLQTTCHVKFPPFPADLKPQSAQPLLTSADRAQILRSEKSGGAPAAVGVQPIVGRA
jgi:hypothetical protein